MIKQSPWSWIPTLYFAEGLPYVAVMTISLVLYKQLGLSNTEITLYTSWLYLPWVIKPLWSPFIDIIRTKRWWITTMELLIGAAFGAIVSSLVSDVITPLLLTPALKAANVLGAGIRQRYTRHRRRRVLYARTVAA